VRALQEWALEEALGIQKLVGILGRVSEDPSCQTRTGILDLVEISVRVLKDDYHQSRPETRFCWI
jgi:hypothetical protein